MHSRIFQITTNVDDAKYDESDVYEVTKHLGVDFLHEQECSELDAKRFVQHYDKFITPISLYSFKVNMEQIQAFRDELLDKYQSIINKARQDGFISGNAFYDITQVLDEYGTFIVIDEYQDAYTIDRWLAQEAQPDTEYFIVATYDYHC